LLLTLALTLSTITTEGNGSTSAFAYPFDIPSAADAQVIYTDLTGLQTTLLPTQYTLSGAGAVGGGTVIYPLSGSPIASGTFLTISRILPLVQTTAISYDGPAFSSIESELDYEMMVLQQLNTVLFRTIRMNVADLGPFPDLPPAAQRANGLLSFDSNGNPAVSFSLSGNAPVSIAMLPVIDAATLTGALALLGAPMRQSSIAALRAFNDTPTNSALVEGFLSPGDGGEGVFVYVPSDTTSADNGGTIIVDASGHRWHRDQPAGPISVKWFGAAGNGSSDDTAEFAAAIAVGGNIYVPEGNYVISSKLAIPSSVALIGAAEKPTITTTAATYTLFSITGSDVVVRNFTIQNAAKTGGADVSIDVGSGTITNVTVDNLITHNSYGLISDSGTAGGFYYALWVTKCMALGLRNIGYRFTRALGFLYVEDCTADYVQSTGATGFTGFVVDNTVLLSIGQAVGGCFFTNCDAQGNSGLGTSNPTQGGFQFANTNEVWMSNCDADNLDSIGYLFNNVAHIHINTCEASICNNFGWSFTNSGFLEASGLRCYGRLGNPNGAAANTPGISFSGGNYRMSFTGISVYNATGDGIVVAAGQAGPINFSGGQVVGCGGAGLVTAGISAVLASGMTFALNASNYSIGGGSQYLQVSQLQSGAVVSVGPGPVSG